jgi:hypothetical protein
LIAPLANIASPLSIVCDDAEAFASPLQPSRRELQNVANYRQFCRMSANLRPIIDEIANQADDFLAGVSGRAQAKAGISELLTMDYPYLPEVDRAIVTKGVMSLLEQEDFFGTEFVGDPFADEDAED